jgi:hypothetical protein
MGVDRWYAAPLGSYYQSKIHLGAHHMIATVDMNNFPGYPL